VIIKPLHPKLAHAFGYRLILSATVRSLLTPDQCCHSVMKKNPRIYLEKIPENNK